MMRRERASTAVSVHLAYALLIILFFIGVPPLVNLVFRAYYYAPHMQSLHNQFMNVETRIHQDLAYLQEHPLFPVATYQRNAHEVLKDKVQWYDTNKSKNSEFIVKHARFFEKTSKESLSTSDLTKDKLVQLHDDYIKHMASTVELEWMSSLPSFDYWSYMADDEYKNYLKTVPSESTINRVATAASLPVPVFGTLKTLALVYFMEKIKNGVPEEGLRVLRHLAFLEQTSGSLLGQSSAIDILKLEAQLTTLFEITSWEPFAEKTLEAYKRVSWAWVGVLFYARSPTQLSAFKPFMRPELGVCTAVHEMPMSYIGYSDLLDRKWPFELHLLPYKKEAIQVLGELQKRCSAQPLNVFLAPVPEGDWFIAEKTFEFERAPADGRGSRTYFNRSKVPFLRQMQGMFLEVLASPNYFKQYEQK